MIRVKRLARPRSIPLLLLGCASALTAAGADSLTAILQSPETLQSRIRFDHLTSANGLSQDSVFSILQDHHGFMWFGTQGGLNRYDGYRFTQYRYDPKNPNSLSGDYVIALAEDKNGGIWTGGLSRFDPSTETFRSYPSNGHGGIYSMVEDRSGFLWMAGTSDWPLYKLHPGTGKQSVLNVTGEVPVDAKHQVVALLGDRDGMLWIGATQGLIRLDPVTGTRVSYRSDISFHGSIRALAQDKAGNIWIAPGNGPPILFDPIERNFKKRWANDPGMKASEINNAMYISDDGVIWLGTTECLRLFDPSSGASGVLHHIPSDSQSLSEDAVFSIAGDRDGNVWAGTKGGGVNRFSPASLRFGAWRPNPADSASLGDDNIRSIYRDRRGTLWIGSLAGGLDRFEPASGNFTHFRHDPRNPRSLDSNHVYTIYEDRAGTLWVGTDLGINRLDSATGSFTDFKRKPGPGPDEVAPTYSLLEDKKGRFWFGTSGSQGILDRKTSSVTLVAKYPGIALYEDGEGNVTELSASLKRPDLSPRGNFQINFFYEQPEGILWLATETGLVLWNQKSKTQVTYTTQDGLPDNIVQCILPDRFGNLWLSTNNGLSKFDPESNTFTNYHEADGLQSNIFNRKSCYADPSGILYFGGLHGFDAFDPQRIHNPPREIPVVLTELDLHGKAVHPGPGMLVSKPLADLNTLRLPYDDDEFSVEFAALTFASPQTERYRFRLEGLERDWTEVDSLHRSARYTGVPPGSYVFRAEASTDGRAWDEKGISLAITVLPPWWSTTWFRILAVLCTAGLIVGAYRYRIRNLELTAARLEGQVSERTRELILAKEAADAANHSKSTFLANMGHELRTPLNAILGFSSLLRERGASEDQKKDLEIINRSGSHLLRLIDELLDMAKIEAGGLTIRTAPFDLWILVGEVMAMLSVRTEEKHLALTHQIGEGVPQYIRADAGRLRQVLINLLGNAIKNTAHGSVTLRLNAAKGTDQGIALLQFEVQDTGIGIAPEDQARIFEPFVQVGMLHAQKGTGLGLAITRRLVEAMGGNIRVQSTPGEGSLFQVELPARLAVESEVRSSRDEGQEILGLESGQPDYRILIVEDQRENWMILERLLGNVGFQTAVAESGEQGVEKFVEWQPHFIWMDLRMPVMDGLETTRRIRALPGGREVKIAAVTASTLESERSRVLAGGLDDYVRKPFQPNEIFECLTRQLGVRYRRAAPKPPSQPVSPPRTEDLAALPQALRSELREAVLSLDQEGVLSCVERISEHNAELGNALKKLSARYAYTSILGILDAAGLKDSAPSEVES
jgi:signal transduction histidine kinase/ligand-binding sensor domain-containing protein/CheY-like chemotaxis protein